MESRKRAAADVHHSIFTPTRWLHGERASCRATRLATLIGGLWFSDPLFGIAWKNYVHRDETTRDWYDYNTRYVYIPATVALLCHTATALIWQFVFAFLKGAHITGGTGDDPTCTSPYLMYTLFLMFCATQAAVHGVPHIISTQFEYHPVEIATLTSSVKAATSLAMALMIFRMNTEATHVLDNNWLI